MSVADTVSQEIGLASVRSVPGDSQCLLRKLIA